MSERKVTFTLRFHALLPADEVEAEQVSDRIGDKIIVTLRDRFMFDEEFREVVAAESFEAYGWDDEEVP